MAVTVTQRIKSTVIPGRSAELYFTIRGADDEDSAYQALLAAAPSAQSSIPRKELQVEGIYINDQNDEDTNPINIFNGIVFYVYSLGELNDIVSFDTTGGTEKITQSYGTTAYGSSPPNFNNAINFDGDKINGIEIITPQFKFQEQHMFNLSQVDSDYRNALALLSGKVNNATFMGHAAGEVLFKGARANKVISNNVERWQIMFDFAVSPNRTGITIGSISGIAKKGWEYLWVLYVDSTDQNRIIQVPSAVYVEQIYEEDDFSNLGIGTS